MKRPMYVFCSMLVAFLMVACGAESQEQSSLKLPEKPESSTETLQNNKTEEFQQVNELKITNIVEQIKINSDIYYKVSYQLGGSKEYKTGYMNKLGIISIDEPKILYEKGDSPGSFILYDNNGNETYSDEKDGNWGILLGTDNGVYVAQEMRSGLDKQATYIGLIDSQGNWLSQSPINLTQLTEVEYPIGASEAKNLGENMLSVYCKVSRGNYLILFDSETGKIIPVENVWNNFLSFYNGTMIFQHWDGGESGGHMGEICSIDKKGNITTLPADGNLLAVNTNGFLTDSNGLSFYTRDGQLVWSFNDYKLSNEFEPVLYEDMVFAYFIGADGNSYIGCISQKTGDLMYEPFKDSHGYIYDHSILTIVSDEKCIVDLMNGKKLTTIQDIDLNYDVEYYSDGPFIIKIDEEEQIYIFYDANGNQLQPVLN